MITKPLVFFAFGLFIQSFERIYKDFFFFHNEIMLNRYGFLTAIIFFFIGSAAIAQQTILSVPSSDVLPGGEIILKQSNRISPFGDNFVSLTPQVIIGTGKRSEISFGVGTNINDHTSVKLNLAAKKVFKVSRSTRITVGGTLSPSLTEGENPDSMVYAHGSYLFKKTKTTLTAGGFVGGKGQMPGLGGVMLGVDQSIISNKLRFVADYMSRDESWGAFSAGFKIRPMPTTSITTAVIVPNASDDRVAFSVSISKYVGKVIPEKIKKEPIDENKTRKDVNL